MKKRLFSLLAFLTFLVPSNAQESDGFIGISLGPSIPLGDFSSKNFDNEDAGLANTGIMFDISFAHKLGKGNFGITALLRGQANHLDAQSIANEFADQFPGINWTVESQSWGIGGFMLGGFASFAISEKASFDTRAMIGFLTANSPDFTIEGTASGGEVWIKQSSVYTTSFAYLVGAGFKFDVGRKLYFLTNLDFLGSNPEFSNVETTASDGSRVRNTWSQSIGTLNISVGIAVKI